MKDTFPGIPLKISQKIQQYTIYHVYEQSTHCPKCLKKLVEINRINRRIPDMVCADCETIYRYDKNMGS